MRTLHRRDGRHLGWDRNLPAAWQLEPGAEVWIELADCFDGQLGPDASAADVAALDLDRANPLTGPIEVVGARAGDTLVVELLEVASTSPGWTTLLPGFGLLADEFPDPHVVVSTAEGSSLDVGGFARVPVTSFLGTVGLAPAEPGPHSVIPPRRVGGNLDCRDVRPGARLLLPVEVDGAWLSLGDPHAAQGDGEVCGTAVEVAASARLRVEVRRGLELPAPQLELPPEGTHPVGPRHVTTGVGPDLETCARDATRAMIEHLGREVRLTPEDAYALCSIAGDLRIAEIVDAPNWVVAMELDLSVFDRD